MNHGCCRVDTQHQHAPPALTGIHRVLAGRCKRHAGRPARTGIVPSSRRHPPAIGGLPRMHGDRPDAPDDRIGAPHRPSGVTSSRLFVRIVARSLPCFLLEPPCGGGGAAEQPAAPRPIHWRDDSVACPNRSRSRSTGPAGPGIIRGLWRRPGGRAAAFSLQGRPTKSRVPGMELLFGLRPGPARAPDCSLPRLRDESGGGVRRLELRVPGRPRTGQSRHSGRADLLARLRCRRDAVDHARPQGAWGGTPHSEVGDGLVLTSEKPLRPTAAELRAEIEGLQAERDALLAAGASEAPTTGSPGRTN